MKKNLRYALLAGSFFMLPFSHASLGFVSGGAGSSAASNCREAIVEHENEDSRSDIDLPLRGVGYDKSLSIALKSVAPKGWKGRLVKNKRIDTSCLLSWDENKSWVEGLDDALADTGLIATLDWKRRDLALIAGKCGGRCVAPIASQVAKIIQKNEVPADDLYTLPLGLNLSEALANFAASQGWTLKWEIDFDYFIEEPIPMRKDFFEAIYDLIETYQSRGGMLGTIPRFSTANKVVSIEIIDNTQR